MQIERARAQWFGIILILLGAILLLDRMNVLDLTFSQIFWPLVMLYGIWRVARGFSRNSQRRVFTGTLFFLYGLFFFIRTWDFVEFYHHTFLAATFLIFGIAFLMLYLNRLSEWIYLIPFTLLSGIGTAFLLTELGYLDRWEVWDLVRLYWPAALVLIGIAIMLRRRGGSQAQSSATPG